MVDPRIYRAALIPVLMCMVLAAFSLQDRPGPIRTSLAADAFDGRRAFSGPVTGLQDLTKSYPRRRPGSSGDRALATLVSTQLRETGFSVRTLRKEGTTIDGRRDLETVVGERSGTSGRKVVIVAHRDAAKPGSAAELSGTAALLELARVFGAPRRTGRTLALVSTSGGSGGDAGVRTVPDAVGGPIDAVLVLGDLASDRFRQPLVAGWSTALGAAPLVYRRTVEQAVRLETGSEPRTPRALVQAARFAAPLTVGEQGPLNEMGVPAVWLSVSGERGPKADDPVSRARLQAFGRAALRTITALDGGRVVPEDQSPELVVARKVLPEWALRLLVGMLLLGPLIAIIDAFARVRRRRDPVVPWVFWILAAAAPFAAVFAFARLLGLTQLLVAPPGPVLPSALPPEAAGLAAGGLVLLLGLLVLRPLVARAGGARGEDPAGPGAAAATLLVLVALTVVVWVHNPYAALLLVPALHLWLFTLPPDTRPRRGIGLLAVVGSLVPAAALVAATMSTFGLGPVDVLWWALLLPGGGYASPVAWIELAVAIGCFAAATMIAWRGREPRGPAADPDITMRGPRTYAGPGSLGGVESALRR